MNNARGTIYVLMLKDAEYEGNIEISVHINQIKELNLYNNRETKAIV